MVTRFRFPINKQIVRCLCCSKPFRYVEYTWILLFLFVLFSRAFNSVFLLWNVSLIVFIETVKHDIVFKRQTSLTFSSPILGSSEKEFQETVKTNFWVGFFGLVWPKNEITGCELGPCQYFQPWIIISSGPPICCG